MAKKIKTDPSELQIALDNRAFEIQLFWQRSNYFIVLMTALGVGVFTIKDSKYAFMISIFAMITSWFWYKTNLGSKFWHESWEVEVVNLAKEQGIRSFERPTNDVIEQVRESLKQASSSGKRGWMRIWLDKQILEKPSVSHYMILLSLTSTALWAVVSVAQGYDLAQSYQLSSLFIRQDLHTKAPLLPKKSIQQVNKPEAALTGQKGKLENPTPQPSGNNRLESP